MTTSQAAARPPRYFADAGQWRAWLAEHHATATEVLVGMYKRGAGRPGMSWSESVDEALCFGWIDAARAGVGPDRYTIRFCVRKAASTWSNVNVAKAEALIAAGRMQPAGLASYRRRTKARTGVYSFEQGKVELDAAAQAAFAAAPGAWKFFRTQPAWYRKKATWWVVRARRPETRARRLARLIALSAEDRQIP